jgi:hypothetical protein
MRNVLTVRHEGQHFLDDLSGIGTRGLKGNESYFEARAFLAEQKLAEQLGMPELGTLGRLESQLGSRTEAWNTIRELYGF